MSLQLTWHGHATWLITADNQRILVDPFFEDSPVATVKAREVEADVILVTHGHFDHISDAAVIAKRCECPVVAIFEIAQWLSEKHRVAETIGMNLGGWASLPKGRVKMVPAWHSSVLPDGTYGGNPAGFVLEIAGRRLYLAGDTALFSDMQLIGQMGLDVALVPIGDLYTMGPNDSIQAIKWLQRKVVFPQHYNTWPPIEQDANAWAQLVQDQTDSQPVVLEAGHSHSID